ncbi:MAG: CinA family protein [Mariprofundaceae bacterium]
MIRAHLIVSEAGHTSLASAGISTGWLSAWIKSAGAEHVELHALNDTDWDEMTGWIIVIADDVDLMRVALAHGKRISADSSGKRTILGSDTFSLTNPERVAWLYKHENSRVLLLPTGDVAYQRFAWLERFNHEQALLPLIVSTDEKVGDILEPGLFGMIVATNVRQHTYTILNDCGYLPEEQLSLLLRKYRMKLRCAESCTSGGVAARISRLPGVSDVLDRGWITYSNESKQDELGVSSKLIEKHGAVSRQVVEAMVKGCVKRGCKDSVAIAVSGIAGPDGGTEAKPVGTVWIAVKLPGEKPLSTCFHFSGSRTDIQSSSTSNGIAMLIQEIDKG